MYCNRLLIYTLRGFPGGATAKEPACQCRRHRDSKESARVRKIPWRRAWQPTPVFCLENSIDNGAWWAKVHRIAKSQT